MNGADTPSFGASIALPSAWQIIQTGDFNGDGTDDILLKNGANRFAVWETNGASSPTFGSSFTVDNGWELARIADTNGDGSEEMVMHSTVDNSLHVIDFSGTQPIEIAQIAAINDQWQLI